jgi:predicted transcriptional regulator YdeE
MSASSAAKTSQIEAQKIDGFYIVGLSILTSNDNDQAAGDINTLWQRFFDEDMLHKIEGRSENVIYAVYSDYEGDHTKPFRVTLGCKVAETAGDLPSGLHKIHVPSANYAIFAARGEQPKSLLQTWEGIWKSNLPRTYQADIEIYGPRFFEDGLHEVLVCVGVKV